MKTNHLSLVKSDPYCWGQRQRVELYIDPQSRSASIDSDSSQPGTTTSDVYHGIALSLPLEPGPRDELDDWLESPKVVALLERIYDGHSTAWNGRNTVGELTDDAQAALDELESLATSDTYPEFRGEHQGSIYDAHDWFASDPRTDDQFRADVNAAGGVEAYAAEVEADAAGEDAIIENVERYVAWRHQNQES